MKYDFKCAFYTSVKWPHYSPVKHIWSMKDRGKATTDFEIFTTFYNTLHWLSTGWMKFQFFPALQRGFSWSFGCATIPLLFFFPPQITPEKLIINSLEEDVWERRWDRREERERDQQITEPRRFSLQWHPSARLLSMLHYTHQMYKSTHIHTNPQHAHCT